MKISKQFRFEASHVLPLHPGKCSRLHGHSWVLDVAVRGQVNKATGFVVDFAELADIVETQLIARVDHQHLGQFDMFNESKPHYAAVFGRSFYPTSENLVVAFAKALKPFMVELGVSLAELKLHETCTSAAIWTPEEDNG